MVFTSSVPPVCRYGEKPQVSDEFVNRQFLPNQATRKIGITQSTPMIHASGAST